MEGITANECGLLPFWRQFIEDLIQLETSLANPFHKLIGNKIVLLVSFYNQHIFKLTKSIKSSFS